MRLAVNVSIWLKKWRMASYFSSTEQHTETSRDWQIWHPGRLHSSTTAFPPYHHITSLTGVFWVYCGCWNKVFSKHICKTTGTFYVIVKLYFMWSSKLLWCKLDQATASGSHPWSKLLKIQESLPVQWYHFYPSADTMNANRFDIPVLQNPNRRDNLERHWDIRECNHYVLGKV